MSKGSVRRPEDAKAIAANWPLSDPKLVRKLRSVLDEVRANGGEPNLVWAPDSDTPPSSQED